MIATLIVLGSFERGRGREQFSEDYPTPLGCAVKGMAGESLLWRSKGRQAGGEGCRAADGPTRRFATTWSLLKDSTFAHPSGRGWFSAFTDRCSP